ncbi:MAG TPA: ribosome silencing factor [bacterium]|nr:ribosome silencing factor [bacterium]HEX67467.1 ribosome silencing factor [bacterium]
MQTELEKSLNQRRERKIINYKEVAREIARICWEKKGEDIVILNLEGLSVVCDYFVIVTGDTEIQTRSISDAVMEKLEGSGITLHHVEGYEDGKWILLDYEGVILHVFTPEIREYYDLERLWGDAEKEKWEPVESGKEDNQSNSGSSPET